MKRPFIVYPDLECLLEKIIKKTTKKSEHKASGYSMFTQCLFDASKNKLDCYRGKDCMERFF